MKLGAIIVSMSKAPKKGKEVGKDGAALPANQTGEDAVLVRFFFKWFFFF